MSTLSDVSAVFTKWRTWRLMADQDIRMRYRRSILGPLWISFSLAATVVALALLYGQIFEQEFLVFLPYIAAGLTTWTLLSALVLEGSSILTDAEHQLRSVSIPSSVLAARMVYRNLVILAHNIIVMIAIVVFFGGGLSGTALWALVGISLIALGGFFLSLILAPICLRFRDVPQVLAVLVQMAFFLTPIFWMPSQGRVAKVIYEFNPFFHFIELVRAPFLGGMPTVLNWTVALGSVSVLGVLALLSVELTRRKIFLWL